MNCICLLRCWAIYNEEENARKEHRLHGRRMVAPLIFGFRHKYEKLL